ncbi:MAG TPA: molybdopterin-dependent oxidoreductase [Streptosporangiaceae bacterium]|nr:molybdopterin-dependent oxidoreductase [Streptosporangiaceae bacterium]
MTKEAEPGPGAGTPVGRRVVVGMLGLAAAGVVGGATIQRAVDRALAPVGERVSGIVPAAGGGFRFYSVVDQVEPRPPAAYALSVTGLVKAPRTFTFADLQALAVTRMTAEFHCVTGWTVPNVQWQGVVLADLLDRVGLDPAAKALRFRSFDGEYTESLTLDQARRRDVLVATGMLGGPISHDHGGPVRLYVAPMYGYKSLKWLSGIEAVDKVVPGYWEVRGYDVDAWINASNGYG